MFCSISVVWLTEPCLIQLLKLAEDLRALGLCPDCLPKSYYVIWEVLVYSKAMLIIHKMLKTWNVSVFKYYIENYIKQTTFKADMILSDAICYAETYDILHNV